MPASRRWREQIAYEVAARHALRRPRRPRRRGRLAPRIASTSRSTRSRRCSRSCWPPRIGARAGNRDRGDPEDPAPHPQGTRRRARRAVDAAGVAGRARRRRPHRCGPRQGHGRHARRADRHRSPPPPPSATSWPPTPPKPKREADRIALDKRLMEQRNDLIFTKLEQAVTVSMEPLDKMFRAAGLSTRQKVLAEIRRGYSGEGGPLTPITFTDQGPAGPSSTMTARQQHARRARQDEPLPAGRREGAGRPAAEDLVPLTPRPSATAATPVTGAPASTPGSDMAGAYGSPIYATADGVVIHAGWIDGYGRDDRGPARLRLPDPLRPLVANPRQGRPKGLARAADR